jgi:hypothetical protein
LTSQDLEFGEDVRGGGFGAGQHEGEEGCIFQSQ